jgi:excisionase family DNA binding protein
MGNDKSNSPTNYQSDYLTRSDVANLFQISLVTVHQWTQQGILKAYRLGSRVYFRRSEIDKALTAIEPKRPTAKPMVKGVQHG